KRQLTVSVKTVTAGIRGTDFWGKSSERSDLVCVIEGNVEVTPPGERPFTLSEPLSFYELEGNLSRPVRSAPLERFREWAAEVAEQEGRGIATREGKWKVTAASPRKIAEAFDVYSALRRAGYAAEIVPSKAGEERVYSVRLANFESEKDARSAVE